MSDVLIRVSVVALVILFTLAIVQGGRFFVERQRRFALAAAPLDDLLIGAGPLGESQKKTRILAFSSEGCSQCHSLQLPALRRLQELRGKDVEVVEVDTATSPELVKRYRVMTVPSTVVLNAAGKVHAVNYGFANLGKLSKQVEELL